MASNNTTWRDPEMLEEAGRLAYEQRIPFSDALAQLSGKTPPPAKEKKQVTRKDFEELRAGIRELAERSEGQLEMLCEREFAQMCMDGTVERRAREKGIPHRDAWQECYEEAYRPLIESQQERRELEQRTAAVELAQQLGQDAPAASGTPVETEEEERERWGFTNREAESRAKRRGISFGDAVTELSEEHAAREAGKAREREELERKRHESARLRLEELPFEEVNEFAEKHELSVGDAYVELGRRMYEEEA